MIKMDDAAYDAFIDKINKMTEQNKKLRLVNSMQAKAIENRERLIYEQEKIIQNQKKIIEDTLTLENEIDGLEF